MWPIVSEDVQERCLQRLTARARFNEGLPNDLANQMVQQFCDEHPERYLLAFVYDHLGNHDLLRVPTDAEKSLVLAALNSWSASPRRDPRSRRDDHGRVPGSRWNGWTLTHRRTAAATLASSARHCLTASRGQDGITARFTLQRWGIYHAEAAFAEMDESQRRQARQQLAKPLWGRSTPEPECVGLPLCAYF